MLVTETFFSRQCDALFGAKNDEKAIERRQLGTKPSMAKGRRNNDAEAILKEPTSSGVSAISPFLIRMNELPQIIAKLIKRTQASTGVFCMQVIYTSQSSMMTRQ